MGLSFDPGEMMRWRHYLHAHPECAFEEFETSAFVARQLAGWDLSVDHGLAGTGVIGTLTNGAGSRSIGLRADMDALAMNEESVRPWRSAVPGKFHGCGHDGHTAMLLGAARHLAATRQFDGTVHFIFQPAEEGKGGGRRMIEEGLFARFPCDDIYAVHNWPALPLGRAAAGPGPMMAAADRFDITFRGPGGHAAMPHLSADTVLAASQAVVALQTIVARSVDPSRTAVVSATSIHGGTTHNIIPQSVSIVGTVRTFDADTQNQIEKRLRALVGAVAAGNGLDVDIVYDRYYPATVNDPACAILAAEAAQAAGLLVDRLPVPSMAAEDFSFMLQACKGAYIWLGQGETGNDSASAPLHSGGYDFNDRLLPIGADYFVKLIERRLPAAG